MRSSSSAAAFGSAVGSDGEGGEALGVGRADLGEAIVNLTGQVGGDVGTKFLGGRRAMREDLDVDPGLVHLLETQAAQVKEPLVRLVASPGFGTGEMLGQFRVPVMLLDGNDRTIRLLHHDASPRTLLEPLRSNRPVSCHRPREASDIKAAHLRLRIKRLCKWCFGIDADSVIHRQCCRFSAFFQWAAYFSPF